MAKSPAVILFDSNGQAMAVEDGVAIAVGTQALLTAGSDGTKAKVLLVDANGRQVLVGSGTAGTPGGGVLTVQGASGGTPIPVSGVVALPTGASTEATLTTRASETTLSALNSKVQSGTIKTDGSATTQPVSGSVSVGNFPATQPVSGSVSVSNLPATQAVSAAALPLPSGAATGAAQTTGNSSLSSIDTKVTGLALDVTLTGGTQKAVIRGGAKGSTTAADVTSVASGANHQALAVAILDGSGNQVTTFGSGTVSVSNFPATQPVSASALPLPTGAATSAKQDTGNTSLSSIDTKTPALVSGKVPVDVGTPAVTVSNFPATQPISAGALPLPSGASTAAKQPALGTAGTASSDVLTVQGIASMTALKVDGSATTQPVSGSVSVSNLPATQAVSAAALPLPSGAATSAAQTTGNNSLSSIDTKVTGLALDATLTGGAQKAILRGGAKGSTSAADVTSLAAGANHQALAVAIVDGSGNQVTSFGNSSVSVSNFPATQPVSAASLPLPTGAATAAKQPALGAAGTPSSDVLTVQGTASMTALKVDGSATTQPVSGSVSVSNFPASQAVSAASLPLPAGAATESTLSALSTKVPTQGQKASAASAPVVLASDQSSIPVAATIQGTPSVSVSNFPATQPVSAASLPLPSGAATSAAQTIGNGSLSSIDTKVTGVALDATLTGGSQKAILRGGAKGATAAADVTSLAAGVNHQALAVAIVDASGTQVTSFGGSVDTSALATSAKQPALGTAGTASADVLTVQGIASMTALKVDGSAVTQPTTNPDVVTTGSVTAISQAVTTPDLNGQGSGMFIISGTFTGTLQFEGAVDGSTYVAVSSRAVNATNLIITISSGGTWRFNCGGFKNFRLRATAWTSGTANITIRTSSAGTGVVLTEPLPNGTNQIGSVSQTGTWTVTQGTPASTVNRWPVQLSDGSSLAAVKAASTAAAATDPALVVAVSPNNTVAVAAASLPLPTGAATAVKQPALGTAGTPASDVLTVQGAAAMTALKVDGSAVTQPVSGSVSISNFPATQAVSGSVSVSNFPATQPVSASSLPLPTGAATETTLSALNTKVPTVGQKASAASSPVVLASDQPSIPVAATIAGTPNVAVSNFPATQPVSATLLPLPSGAATAAKQPALGTAGTPAGDVLTVQGAALMTALKVDGSGVTQPVSGSVSVSNFPGSQTVSGSVNVSNFPATQAVSAASLPLPTGAATAAKQPALGAAGTPSADVLTVQGSASMTALKVDGSAVTQPVTASSLPLPTGAATETTLGSRLADSTFTGRINTQGQKASAASTPVVLASDQSSIPVAATISGTPNVAVTSSALPSGAATAVKQPALGTAGIPSTDVLTVQGAASMTALKVDGSATTQPVSIAAAVPVTDNAGSLTVDSTQLPASLGQKTMANSMGVAIASDQTLNVNGAAQQATGSLAALNAVLSVVLNGRTSVGVTLNTSAPAFIGTLLSQFSMDGITWSTASWFDPWTAGTNYGQIVQSEAFNSSNQAFHRSVVLPPGTSAVRVFCTAYTSGSISCTISASNTQPVQPMMVNPASAGYHRLTDGTNVAVVTALSALKVDSSATTQPVSGTVTANIGTAGSLALDATLTGGSLKSIIRGGAKGATAAADVTSVATGANHQALVVAIVDALGNQLTNFGSPLSTTTTTASVAGSATSVQLLAANSAREGATVYNDSTSACYLKLGTTASTTSFTVKILANGYYEIPFGYSGRIDAIWAAATGSARVTEFS